MLVLPVGTDVWLGGAFGGGFGFFEAGGQFVDVAAGDEYGADVEGEDEYQQPFGEGLPAHDGGSGKGANEDEHEPGGEAGAGAMLRF